MDDGDRIRGERLRAARKEAGLSVAQVAERTGYSQSGVRALENGQNGLGLDAAELFAPVVKRPTAWLLGIGEPLNEPPPPSRSDQVVAELRRLRVPHEKVAEALSRDTSSAARLIADGRLLKSKELGALEDLIVEYERNGGGGDEGPLQLDYVPIEVLPTYAGMGGGGTGDADRQLTMLPRALVEMDLRAKPEDLLVINVRGNSMEPLFYHDDQLVIDRRDTNPIQPGPFALWDGDGYVVKNVERNPKTRRYRVFSSNPAYSPHEFEPDQVKIMGRPVWYARRL